MESVTSGRYFLHPGCPDTPCCQNKCLLLLISSKFQTKKLLLPEMKVYVSDSVPTFQELIIKTIVMIIFFNSSGSLKEHQQFGLA